ncbi:hypothetical protein FOCC_FOCC014588 [Frankliniella occidentalis]|nr:hypothetical protein FOCC_FOCC014588 [Frankliniella occidentalis]
MVGTGLHLVTQDPESLVLQRVRSAVPMMIGVTSCEMAQSADAQFIPSKDTQRVLNISAEALGYNYEDVQSAIRAYHGADDFKVWPIFANTSYNGTSPDSLLLRRLVKFISNFIKYM